MVGCDKNNHFMSELTILREAVDKIETTEGSQPRCSAYDIYC